MWHNDGFDWHAPESPAALPRTLRAESGRAPIRQSITIEPHHHNWLFALDWPAGSVPGAFVAPGNYLWSGQPINRQRRYEVVSVSRLGDKRLNERERKLLLQSQPQLSPKAWSLAQSWTSQTKDPRSIVNAGLDFFRTQGFRYSLSPGEYKKNGLDEFLFNRRQGFCEHYASSFATLMRFAGIPARVVTGYLGGEYNELGKFLVVRQADAHAWCEVWLPGTGWERIDPTSVVAPDRINLGLGSFLERRAAGQTVTRSSALARWPVFVRARLAWQTLNYTWDTHVIGFDGEAQEALISAIGLGEHNGMLPISGICIAIVILLVVYAGWSRFRSRSHGDRVSQLWMMFCRKTARLGVARNLTEGPLAFSQRAISLLPNESQRIRTITEAYILLRFASCEDRHLLSTFARDVVLFGRDPARQSLAPPLRKSCS